MKHIVFNAPKSVSKALMILQIADSSQDKSCGCGGKDLTKISHLVVYISLSNVINSLSSMQP